MIKRTLYFGNPAYLSMNNAQMVIKIPEVESAANVCEAIKKDAIRNPHHTNRRPGGGDTRP